MKMNKRKWIVLTSIFVIALSAFAVKSEAALFENLTEIRKENVSIFQTATTQPKWITNMLDDRTYINCEEMVDFAATYPQSGFEWSNEGVRFTVIIRFHWFYNIGNTYPGCRDAYTVAPHPEPSNHCVTDQTTVKIVSGPRDENGNYSCQTFQPCTKRLTMVCKPNISASEKITTIRIAQKPIEIKQKDAGFNLMNWIKQKVIESARPPCTTPKCLERKTRPNAAFGIRG